MKKITSINPANNKILDEVLISSDNEIIEKVKQAHIANEVWRFLGIENRVKKLQEVFHVMKKHEKEIAKLTTQEMGKPITESLGGLPDDFAYFQAFLDEGPNYIKDEITVAENSTQHNIVYEPRGVVASIVAWNYPLSNFIWAVIPNLIVGNTVVFKHSEECPLLGKFLEKIILESTILPPGVFSEVYGGRETGELLIKQNIDLIRFTGSSAVGKKLYEIAGQKQIRAVLEMGGSNPGIIFEDVNLDQVVKKIVYARFSNCGQMCDAIKRVIIHRSLYEKFIEKLSVALSEMVLGDPLQESTQLGPLVSLQQLELLESQVNDSIQAGAKIIIGGSRPKQLIGAYYLPTILVNVNREMRVWKEEVFGPVLPVVFFENEDEAVALANDTIYGLGASIFSKDLNRARRVATQIDAGFVNINDGDHWRPCNPFGGHKASGIGCEHGRWGFQELCKIKVVAES